MVTDLSLQISSQTDQWLERMLYAFDDLILIVGEDGVILEHKSGNPFQINGFPLDFLKKKLQDLLSDDASRKIVAGLHKLRWTNRAIQLEFFIPTPDGRNWYESRLVPKPDRQVAVLIRDITKYKQSEEVMEVQLRQLATLRTIDLAITSGADLNQILSMILDYVKKHLNVDAASVLLFNSQTQRLDFAAGAGFWTSALQHTHLKMGEGLAGQAAQERSIIHIPDLKKSETGLQRSTIFSGENFSVYYAVPLIVRDQMLGVLEIFHRSAVEVRQGWENFLHALAGQASIAIDNAMMFKNLQRSNIELTLAYDKTIDGWSRALNFRDEETEDHTRRVTEITMRMAKRMHIPDSELIHIRRGSTLHDIGKVAIPDHILLKPAPLTGEEWDIMRRHPLIAAEILKPIAYLAPALPIPRYHHEKWDGSGYPDGLAGKTIPLEARLFAFADVYDALTSNRPYRPEWAHEKALEYIGKNSGLHFDPDLVPEFIAMMAG